MRTHCCTFRGRQGHTGNVIASTELMLPAGFSGTVRRPSSFCAQGICVAQHSPKAKHREENM